MQKSQLKLGEILLSRGLITRAQLEAALAEQALSKEFLGRIMVRSQIITEHNLLTVLSEQFNIPIVQIKPRDVDWEFAKSFPSTVIIDHRCLPVRRDEWTVTVAITNPLDMWVLKLADECCSGLKLKLVLISEADLENATYVYKQYQKKKIEDMFK